MIENMQLPKGMNCGKCRGYPKCVQLFGCNSDNTECDWSPSRFIVNPQTEIDTLKSENEHFKHLHTEAHKSYKDMNRYYDKRTSELEAENERLKAQLNKAIDLLKKFEECASYKEKTQSCFSKSKEVTDFLATIQ